MLCMIHGPVRLCTQDFVEEVMQPSEIGSGTMVSGVCAFAVLVTWTGDGRMQAGMPQLLYCVTEPQKHLCEGGLWGFLFEVTALCAFTHHTPSCKLCQLCSCLKNTLQGAYFNEAYFIRIRIKVVFFLHVISFLFNRLIV